MKNLAYLTTLVFILLSLNSNSQVIINKIDSLNRKTGLWEEIKKVPNEISFEFIDGEDSCGNKTNNLTDSVVSFHEGLFYRFTGEYYLGKKVGLWKRYIGNDDSWVLIAKINYCNDSAMEYELYYESGNLKEIRIKDTLTNSYNIKKFDELPKKSDNSLR